MSGVQVPPPLPLHSSLKLVKLLVMLERYCFRGCVPLRRKRSAAMWRNWKRQNPLLSKTVRSGISNPIKQHGKMIDIRKNGGGRSSYTPIPFWATFLSGRLMPFGEPRMTLLRVCGDVLRLYWIGQPCADIARETTLPALKGIYPTCYHLEIRSGKRYT